jgi:hypothetical protein
MRHQNLAMKLDTKWSQFGSTVHMSLFPYVLEGTLFPYVFVLYSNIHSSYTIKKLTFYSLMSWCVGCKDFSKKL